MHIREVRSNRRLAKISADNLTGRVESGSLRAGHNGAALRVNAALIRFRQLSEELGVVAAREHPFGQNDGCVLTAPGQDRRRRSPRTRRCWLDRSLVPGRPRPGLAAPGPNEGKPTSASVTIGRACWDRALHSVPPIIPLPRRYVDCDGAKRQPECFFVLRASSIP